MWPFKSAVRKLAQNPLQKFWVLVHVSLSEPLDTEANRCTWHFTASLQNAGELNR